MVKSLLITVFVFWFTVPGFLQLLLEENFIYIIGK